MADNQEESGLSVENGTPNPQSSQAGGSSTSLDVEALAKALQPHIRAEVERTQQSVKDKRIGKLEGQVSDFAEQLAKLKALQAEGWTEQQAMRLMQLDNLAQPSQEAGPPKPQGSGVAVPGVEAQAVIKAMGYDMGGEEVTRVLREHPNDAVAQVNALANLRVQAATQVRQPNPAQVMSAGSGQSIGITTESLKADYDKLTEKLPRGVQGLQGRVDAKIAIQKKAREAGVQSPV